MGDQGKKKIRRGPGAVGEKQSGIALLSLLEILFWSSARWSAARRVGEDGRGRGIVAAAAVLMRLARTCAVLAGVLLLGSPRVLALDPALDVSQYAHTAWKIRDGFAKGEILAIAQTPDGYLWVGTEFGLLRFDGVRAVPWQPPLGQSLPSTDTRALLSARDGTLWIGTTKGLASWKDGKLTHYPELRDLIILRLLEDRQGTIWVGAYGVPSGRLCSVQKGAVQCYGEDGHVGPGVIGLLEDSKGNLWAGVVNGLWRWKPGPPKFYSLPGEPNGIMALIEDTGGDLLFGWRRRLYKLHDGKPALYPLPGTGYEFLADRLLRDRNGGLWIGTIGTNHRGLLHVHEGRTDVFSSADGLSSDDIEALFEDREGDVWVATFGGLDRFRNFVVATLSVKQGVSHDLVGSVLAAKDGTVWLGTYKGLDRWLNGEISAFGKQGGKLNGHAPNSLFQDSRGRICVSTFYDVGYLEEDQFVSINGLPGGNIHGIGEDSEGNLWIANKESGLFRRSPGKEIQRFPWNDVKAGDYAEALVADSLRGGLWLGFSLGGVAYFADGQIRRSYAAADGLGGGWVGHLRLDPDGTLWAATEGGLSRLKNGHFATLTSRNGLPCDAVHWSMEDDAHSLWLYMSCGLVRIAAPELDTWVAAVDKSNNATTTVQATVFDISDGVRAHAPGAGYAPPVAKSADGRLWFVPLDGLSFVDPAHLPFNKRPPPVHIEQVTADGKTYDTTQDVNGHVQLPARIRDLQIDYTALSLVAPEKILFRYKLEGRDNDWQDAGNRRQAFYTDLPARNYRFRVMACNNSGVWNEEGAALDFAIAPAYYQTNWFRAACVAVLLLVLWGLHGLRLRRLAKEFNLRMDERVNERTRIARELHDTLLQSFQGALLYFQTGVNLLPDRPDNARAKQQLVGAIDQAAQAIAEGRDAVQDLRSSTIETNNLAMALKTLAGELASNETNQSAPAVGVRVEGASRDIHPILRDEVYRIAAEALRNAFRHAQAKRLEVEIHYALQQLRLRVRDDGKGMDAKIVAETGRPGHYGLRGMRERAQQIGAQLNLWSEVGVGTEVQLTIPAAVAYETARDRSVFRLFRKGQKP